MPILDESMYRQRFEVVAQMIAQLLAGIPDAYTGDDGIISIVFNVEAGQLENLYLANQILLEDMFIPTASYNALLLHGEQYGLDPLPGLQSAGTLEFSGPGGTYIPIGSEVGYDPGDGLDVIYFLTTTDGTIPDPGAPSAPTAAVNATAGNLTGTYEWAVSFVTATGETLTGPISNPISPSAQQANLTAIPIGGPGTTARKIYRDRNGLGNWRLVATISDNVTTTFTDNVTNAVHDANPAAPTVDTAHQVIVNGQAEDTGSDGNVGVGTITELTNAPTNLIGVINPTAFTGGTAPENTESYRERLLAFIQNPATGSANDLEMWALGVNGVETATAFPNTPSAGSVTVRITGPAGSIPGADVIAAVQDVLNAQDLANITIIVATFTAVPTNVTVVTTLDPAFTLSDVSTAVVSAITNYINGLDVGGTLYVTGIIAAVLDVPGVIDVSVTTPATNQTTASTSKRTAGTISVS